MRGTKKEGPGKIICDTQEKSSRVPLMDPSPEISAISAGAKAIIAFFLRNSRPSAGGPGGHRGALPLVLALAQEYFDNVIGGGDALRLLLEYLDIPVKA